MLSSIKAGTAPATLKKVTYRQLVKAAATVRNQTVTYEGVTQLELAFGRRPADLIQLDVATPTQLTIDRNEEELTAIQIKQLSKQAFQEARQSEDIRRNLAQNLRMSSKPLQVKGTVFYWQEDKSKIRSDGSKGGIWLKGKVISLEGAMVGLDLGTRLIKVNMTKVTSLRANLELIAGKTTPKPAAPHPADNMFVEDLASLPEQAHWSCVRKGKIHVLEIFAGSARFSQLCALSGLKVGTPVDIRTGFDVMIQGTTHGHGDHQRAST